MAATGQDLFCPIASYFRKPYHAEFLPIEPGVVCDVLVTFDVETTGPNIDCAMIEVAAVVTTVAERVPVVLGVYEGFMRVPDGKVWDGKTVSEFWNRTPDLRAKKVVVDGCTFEPAEVMPALCKFLTQIPEKFCGGDSTRVSMASDNAGFDIKWIDNYIGAYASHFDTINTFYGSFSPVIDTDSHAMGVAGDTVAIRGACSRANGWYSADTAACKKLKIIDGCPESPNDHRAANDALFIAQMYLYIVHAE